MISIAQSNIGRFHSITNPTNLKYSSFTNCLINQNTVGSKKIRKMSKTNNIEIRSELKIRLFLEKTSDENGLSAIIKILNLRILIKVISSKTRSIIIIYIRKSQEVQINHRHF